MTRKRPSMKELWGKLLTTMARTTKTAVSAASEKRKNVRRTASVERKTSDVVEIDLAAVPIVTTTATGVVVQSTENEAKVLMITRKSLVVVTTVTTNMRDVIEITRDHDTIVEEKTNLIIEIVMKMIAIDPTEVVTMEDITIGTARVIFHPTEMLPDTVAFDVTTVQSASTLATTDYRERRNL
jgi:hypothetical protein